MIITYKIMKVFNIYILNRYYVVGTCVLIDFIYILYVNNLIFLVQLINRKYTTNN